MASGKILLITGVSSGFGRALAQEALAAGSHGGRHSEKCAGKKRFRISVRNGGVRTCT